MNAGARFDVHKVLRPLFKGNDFAGAGLDQQKAEGLVGEKMADAAVFGSLFISNPDLPERFLEKAPLAKPDSATFYLFLRQLRRGQIRDQKPLQYPFSLLSSEAFHRVRAWQALQQRHN
jgi:hypothetical protein